MVVVSVNSHGIQLIVREAALERYKQSRYHYSITAKVWGKSGMAYGQHIVLAGSTADRG